MKNRAIPNPNKEYVVQNLVVKDPELAENGITDEMLDEAQTFLFIPDEELTKKINLKKYPETLQPYRRYSAANPYFEIEDKTTIDGSDTEPGPGVVIPSWGSESEVAQALASHLADDKTNPHKVDYEQTGLSPMSDREIKNIVNDAFNEGGE